MILVYVDNKHFGEVSNLSFTGRVAYRNPRYFKEVENCDGVYIHGNYPEIEKAYKGKLIDFESNYPIDKGAGWFELSNGKSVRGEEKAIQAQKELD